MAAPDLTLDKSKGPLGVEIIIGHAQFGKYQFLLWDEHDKDPQILCIGTNDDDKDDEFTLDNVTELNGRMLSWEVIVSTLSSNTNQYYSVTVRFRQEGQTVQGGLFVYRGKIDRVELVSGGVRLKHS